MVDIPALREEVKILAEKAVKADKCKDYENAIQYYSKAAKKLNYIKKSDDNIYIKDLCRKREFEYINRAKYIKEVMEKRKGKDKKGDNCEGDDNEINENIIVNKIKNFNEIIDVNILERDSKILLKTFSEKDLNQNNSNELIKKDDNNDNDKINKKKINFREINLSSRFNDNNKGINEFRQETFTKRKTNIKQSDIDVKDPRTYAKGPKVDTHLEYNISRFTPGNKDIINFLDLIYQKQKEKQTLNNQI